MPTDTLTVSSAVFEPWAISTNHAETSTSPPKYYQEALDYMLKNMPDQDPSQLYSSLAEYYRNTQKDYATALDYCEKALKSAKTERNIAQAMIENAWYYSDRAYR